MRHLAFYRNQISEARGRRATIVEDLEATKDELQEIKEQGVALERGQVLIQKVAQETQEQLRYHIEDIVQLAIETCFPDRYLFRVAFEIKRGKTEARLFLFDEGGNEISPMDGCGGGVVDITSFALRIAGWTLGRTANTIALDEPFRFLSAGLRPRAAAIVRQLSHRLGLQFIIVTHVDEQIVESDRVFHISLAPSLRSKIEVEDLT